MSQSKTRQNLVSLTFASVLATTVTAWGLGAANGNRAESRRQTSDEFYSVDAKSMAQGARLERGDGEEK